MMLRMCRSFLILEIDVKVYNRPIVITIFRFLVYYANRLASEKNQNE